MTNEQREEIKALREQGYGYTAIGRELNLSSDSVRSFCRREKKKEEAERVRTLCKFCGRPIKQRAKRKPRMFCSSVCRTHWWNSHLDCVNRKAIYHFICTNCGKSFTAYGNSHRKYCSHTCYIADRYGKELVSNG